MDKITRKGRIKQACAMRAAGYTDDATTLLEKELSLDPKIDAFEIIFNDNRK